MCKLRDDTMSQAGELTMEKKMEELSKVLPDLSGPAVRGEAVAEMDGWKIGNACNGRIAVSKDGVGGYSAQREDDNIASSILYELACSLRYAPASPDLRGAGVREAMPTDELYGAVMNIPCKMGRATEMHGATKQAYKEGHRDARHAAADLIAEHSGRDGVREAMPEGYASMPNDPAINLSLGWAYLDAARKAEPEKEWAFSHAGYRAMLAVAMLAPRTADAPFGENEAVALTDVDRMRMPKRDAFIKWAKGRALDVSETKDAWGNRSFAHPHIESIWFGWFHAPSQPSCKLCSDTGDMSLGPTDNFGQCSCRAADALDSQPTGLPTFHATQVENIELALAQELDDAAFNQNDFVTVNREKLRGIAERILAAAKLEVSSRPTDGGVRNGN